MGRNKLTSAAILEHILAQFGFDPPDIFLDRSCKLIEKDHAKDPRVFAHVFHRRNKAICVCRAFSRLPLGHRIGIILHEIGHLMSDGGEAEADLWVQDNLHIDIAFKDTLQWVPARKVGL
jgi:hypothetical protein